MTTPAGPGQFSPTGPHAYQSPAHAAAQATAVHDGAGPQPTPPPRPDKPERNVLGIVAFVTAVLGFIFAVWEGAYLLGWILLPIAFVLSLVAMFQKGKGKGMAVTALIVSIVGTTSGAVAFLGSAVSAIDDAFNEDVSVVEPADPTQDPAAAAPENQHIEEAEAGDEAEPVTEPEQPVSAGGTRANPHPLGTTIASDDWEVTVTSFIPDATQDVLDANQFNEAPEEGHTYALVGISVTRLGPESGTTMEVGVDYVTAEGNVVSRSDAFAVAPEELSYEELFQGAGTSGNVVLMIPDGGTGTVRVSPGWFTDEAFFATS